MKRRILFVGHDFKFLRPILDHYASLPDWEVSTHAYKGHILRDEPEAARRMDEADVVFCEWCLGNAEWASHRKRPDQILLIRLHHQEMSLRFLDAIDWGAVDCLCFICHHHLHDFRARFPAMAPRTRLIYNAIDCDAFDLPKEPGARFHLGFMGMSPMRKAPHLAVEILQRLRQRDPRFVLHFKGHHPSSYEWLWRRPEERAYYEALFERLSTPELAGSVVLDPHGEDVPAWLRGIGFVLSTSDHEGSHQAVAEGMASGAVPVIRDWRGADLLYPPRFVFADVDTAVERLVDLAGDGLEAERAECRTFARQSFDRRRIVAEYDRLLAELVGREGRGTAPAQTAPRDR